MVDFAALTEKLRKHREAGHPGSHAFCKECGNEPLEESYTFPSETGRMSAGRPPVGETLPEVAEVEETEDEEEGEDVPPLPQWAFLTGTAGTGKTFTARGWVDEHPEAELVATTGIAAINIGGCTINSLLRFYDTSSLEHGYLNGWLQRRLKELAEAGTTRLILDEVSMLDGAQLDILVDALDEVNGNLKRPLGLILVGDFAQLPPVKGKFAFAARTWGRFGQNTTLLTEIRRQSDQDFIAALQAVRRGDGKKALEFFESRLERVTARQFKGSTIVAKNDQVDRFNHLKLEELKKDDVVFTKQMTGVQEKEWDRNIPEQLILREGAQVMILANRTQGAGNYVYVNGDTGTFRQKWSSGDAHEYAAVILNRTGATVDVEMVERKKKEPTGTKRDPYKEVGRVKYMPLRLAWATTVHKSQGLSLDSVQVDITNHFFGEPGMMYVALSRARTAEGLRLVGTPKLFVERAKADPRVRQWL